MDVKRLVKGSGDFERLYQENLKKWWTDWGFPIPPYEYLPTNLVVAYHDGNEPCAAGFIYQTDSKIAWLEWIVADRQITKGRRAEALDAMIEGSKAVSVILGATALFTSSKSKSLNDRLERSMKLTDSGMSHFIWRG